MRPPCETEFQHLVVCNHAVFFKKRSGHFKSPLLARKLHIFVEKPEKFAAENFLFFFNSIIMFVTKKRLQLNTTETEAQWQHKFEH